MRIDMIALGQDVRQRSGDRPQVIRGTCSRCSGPLAGPKAPLRALMFHCGGHPYIFCERCFGPFAAPPGRP